MPEEDANCFNDVDDHRHDNDGSDGGGEAHDFHSDGGHEDDGNGGHDAHDDVFHDTDFPDVSSLPSESEERSVEVGTYCRWS